MRKVQPQWCMLCVFTRHMRARCSVRSTMYCAHVVWLLVSIFRPISIYLFCVCFVLVFFFFIWLGTAATPLCALLWCPSPSCCGIFGWNFISQVNAFILAFKLLCNVDNLPIFLPIFGRPRSRFYTSKQHNGGSNRALINGAPEVATAKRIYYLFLFVFMIITCVYCLHQHIVVPKPNGRRIATLNYTQKRHNYKPGQNVMKTAPSLQVSWSRRLGWPKCPKRIHLEGGDTLVWFYAFVSFCDISNSGRNCHTNPFAGVGLLVLAFNIQDALIPGAPFHSVYETTTKVSKSNL